MAQPIQPPREWAPSVGARDSGLTTLDIPHDKIKAGYLYYVGRLPDGEFWLHKVIDGSGYQGVNVPFLMADGSVEIVRGPYQCNGGYDCGDLRRVLLAMGYTRDSA